MRKALAFSLLLILTLGVASAQFVETVEVRVTNVDAIVTDASLARRKEVTVKLDVTADAQVGAISLGVLDDGSNATGFALVKLDPAPEKTGSTE